MENMVCVVVVVTVGLQMTGECVELGGVDGTIDGGSSGEGFRPRDFVKGNMCTMFVWVEKKVEPTTTTRRTRQQIFRHVGPPKVLCLFWENGPTLFTEHHEGEGGEANEDRQSHR